jgi:hypothetical protein
MSFSRIRGLKKPASRFVHLRVENLEERLVLSGGEFRTIDGVGNNMINPLLGSAPQILLRKTPAFYQDGVNTPRGTKENLTTVDGQFDVTEQKLLPSARAVSNVIHHQGNTATDFLVESPAIPSARNLSMWTFQWGQFIDHDIGLTEGQAQGSEFNPPGGVETFPIRVPTGDPAFDPNSTGMETIDFTRAIINPGSGTSSQNQREQQNEITAFIDGSNIYGSDDQRAMNIRTGTGGRLLTQPGPDGDLLIFNRASFTGGFEQNANALNAPEDTLFISGDVRANEQVDLTVTHTLFMREHNRKAAEIAATDFAGQDLSDPIVDEEIYQRAREWVGAVIENITYNEFLPAIMGPNFLPPYQGYLDTENPNLANIFSGAAYRVGHTMLPSELVRLDANGNVIPEGNLRLRDGFFAPDEVSNFGLDPYLRGLAATPQEEIDRFVVNDVRNFLFGPPAPGSTPQGLDLAALNIQRGRDHGLPGYNQARETFGLTTADNYEDITGETPGSAPVAEALRSLYGRSLTTGEEGLTGDQEVPSVTTTATAVANLSLNPEGQALAYEITVKGLDFGTLAGVGPQTADPSDDVTALHFHNAARGANGGIVFGIIDPMAALEQDGNDRTITINPDGSTTIRGVWEESDPASTPLSTFIPALMGVDEGSDVNLYLNVHTVGNPGGEIRGQLVGAGDNTGNVDVWTGGLVEPHVPGTSMGLLFFSIWRLEFLHIRGGDRFYFENQFSGDELEQVKGMTLSRVIELNSNADVQDNVFFAPTNGGVNVTTENTDGIAAVDPLSNTFYVRNTPDAGATSVDPFAYGLPGWTPVSGDWTGNNQTGIAVVEPAAAGATWYLRNTATAGAPDIGPFAYGASNWIPVAGDWDGNGSDTVGIVDPTNLIGLDWHLRNDNSAGPADIRYIFGLSNWIPVAGDWNGDGVESAGVFDPDTATFHLRPSNNPSDLGVNSFQFGAGGWTPVVGDWDGDGIDTIGVVDPTTGTWYLRNSNDSGAPDAGQFDYGLGGWTPLGGDWNASTIDPSTAVLLSDNQLSGPPADPISQTDLAALANSAVNRLLASDVDPANVAPVSNANIILTDLPGHILGALGTDSNTILIDQDAAGRGWFVDQTPFNDEEFNDTPSGLASIEASQGHADLLTVLARELAQLNGATGSDPLLGSSLPDGVRRLGGYPGLFS